MAKKEKLDLIYEQNCQDFRSLNEIMWRVPILAMSLTGGLGVAIATFDLGSPARTALLIFAGVANVVFLLVLFRLRYIMHQLLEQIHSYQGTRRGSGFFVVTLFSLVLLVGALGCFLAAAEVGRFFPIKTKSALTCAHGTANITVGEVSEQNRILLEVMCEPYPKPLRLQRYDLQRGP